MSAELANAWLSYDVRADWDMQNGLPPTKQSIQQRKQMEEIKKYKVIIGEHIELDKLIQKVAYDNDKKWCGEGRTEYYGKPYDQQRSNHALILVLPEGTIGWGKADMENEPCCTTVDVVRFIELLKTPVFKPVELKLNETYSAVIDKTNVKVGCQIFSHEAVLSVVAAVKEINTRLGRITT